jgi:transcriptional regulator with XRE-family HTH domain
MKDQKILNKLNEIASKEPSTWIVEAEQRLARREWIEKSSRIAMRILNEIRSQKISNGMSQQILSEKMGVSPQYISKILKGHENLSLETISKIEKVLGISLIDIPNFVAIQEIQIPFEYELYGVSKNQARKVFVIKPETITHDNYYSNEIIDKRA